MQQNNDGNSLFIHTHVSSLHYGGVRSKVNHKHLKLRNKTGHYTCHGFLGELPSSPALPEGTVRSGGYCCWLVRSLLDELLVSGSRNNAGREADQ